MFLNVIQLAESFGVEERVVDMWVRKEGLPCVRDRDRLLFDRNQVVAWAAERGLAAKAGFLAPAARSGTQRLAVDSLLRRGGIWRDVPVERVPAVLEQVVARLPASEEIRRMLAQRVRGPEGITWAPVGHGLALPHLRARIALGGDSGLLACLFLAAGIPLEDVPDNLPVTRLLFFIAPSPRAHLELLGRLSTALRRGVLAEALLSHAPNEQLFAALAAVENGENRTEGGKT